MFFCVWDNLWKRLKSFFDKLIYFCIIILYWECEIGLGMECDLFVGFCFVELDFGCDRFVYFGYDNG